MTLWLIDSQKHRRRLIDRFTPSFYAGGPEPKLRQLAAHLGARHAGVGCQLSERQDIWSGTWRRVLRITVPGPLQLPPLVRQVMRLAPGVELFNCDLLPEAMYNYERGLFPLARCAVEFDADGWVRQIEPQDNAWSLDYELPPLTVMELRPAGLRLPPQHGPRSALLVRVEDQECEIDETQDEPAAQTLARLVAQHDPDLLLTRYGDSFLLPQLLRQAARLGVSLGLNRDPNYRVEHRRARSYFSYGRIVFKDSATLLRGRLHVDAENSFVVGESELAGLFELARLTKLPVQYMARTSTGTGITSMQLDIAYREGILIPWEKREPEEFKSAEELLRADRGGLVYQPVLGLHENVAELDFASMFPAIMATFNVSPETTNCACCRNHEVPELGYSLCQRRRGLVPKTVAPLIAKRSRYKALRRLTPDPGRQQRYDNCQNAIKWLLVTCFGYLGYKNARFGRIEAHEAINCFGREKLLVAKESAERAGFRLLHAIVDSLWVHKPDATEKEYRQLADSIAARTGLPVALEGVYKILVFCPSRTSPEIPVPNRYFGFFADGRIKVRGLEVRRHDAPPIVKRMQKAVLDILAAARDACDYGQRLQEAEQVFRAYLQEVLDGSVPPAELVISKRLTNYPERYEKNSLVAVVARQLRAGGVRLRPGESVAYIVTDAAASLPSDRACPVAQFAGDRPYDRQHYARLLAKAFEPFMLYARDRETLRDTAAGAQPAVGGPA